MALERAFKLFSLSGKLQTLYVIANIRAASRFLSGGVYGKAAFLVSHYSYSAFFSYHLAAAHAFALRNAFFESVLHNRSLLRLCGLFLLILASDTLRRFGTLGLFGMEVFLFKRNDLKILGSYSAFGFNVNFVACKLRRKPCVLTLIADSQRQLIVGNDRLAGALVGIEEYNPYVPAYTMTQAVVSTQYSRAELMQRAGMNTLMGMGVVFLVLIFISFIIGLFKHMPGSGAKQQQKKQEAKKTAPAAAAPAPAVKEEKASENLMNDQELVAVITAAILAANGNASSRVSSDKLVVRSIKRASR